MAVLYEHLEVIVVLLLLLSVAAITAFLIIPDSSTSEQSPVNRHDRINSRLAGWFWRLRGKAYWFRLRLKRRLWASRFLAIPLVAVVLLLVTSPWPTLLTLRHYGALPNCDAARTMGLAPANRGEPGYWPKHDRDQDGIACEPWTPRF